MAGTALLAPSAALACNNGGPSAVNVYKECVPSGGGSKPTSGGSSKSTTLPVSSKTARALAHAGRDKQVLSNLVRNPDLGAVRELQSIGATSTKAPSALGSAFDLGSGPTALLAVLVGTAVLLLGAGGFRGWRRWRGNH